MIKTLSLFFSALVICFHVHAQYETRITVAADGSGDYTSIQDAIDAAKAFPDERIEIFIRNGVYREKVKVHSWNTKLSLIGESVEHTIIVYDDYFGKIGRGRNSTFFTYTLLVEGVDFYAENLTIQNAAGPVGQAVALHVEADRCEFVNCRFIGFQDTLYLAGENARQYFSDCYIEGTTDFIFGEATALFHNCDIHSKSDSYITAASTPEGVEYGFVFIDCRLTAGEGVNRVFLGRPWRVFAKTVFIHTEMGAHICPEGWHNWGKEEAGKTVFYAEYQSYGPGANAAERVDWSRRLTSKQAKKYTMENIFRGWKPLSLEKRKARNS